ncbi:glutamate-5-semialdehyde dehydrogenase [Spirochaeta africana]|nr:glutamate-5-semialdehyde dehydrogenase [Spirochaeta africana]
MSETVQTVTERSRHVAPVLAACSGETISTALNAMADSLQQHAPEIFAANNEDILRSQEEQIDLPLLKRLKFDQPKLDGVTDGLRQLAAMENPLGKIQSVRELDAGLILERVSCPIGVIGMIFESRPDALVQIAGLCAKSGNAVILKGGREAMESNRILSRLLHDAGTSAGLPDGWLALIETREDVQALLTRHDDIDLLIPRGSNEFVQYIMHNTTIPVLGHADGICHVYLDKDAETGMAVDISLDSKTQYLAVCNAAETLLIHREAAARLLPPLHEALSSSGVEVRGCEKTRALVPALPATEEDWASEYLDAIISVRIVDSLEQAVEHINTYGSGHTDAIVTSNQAAAELFMRSVDTANAFWNASTRFADGYRYGLGAEVGISTGKIHARGPVGIEGLMIYQWRLRGNGQIVAPYAAGSKRFTHRDIT